MIPRRIRRVLIGTALVAALTASMAVAATIQTYSQKFSVGKPGKTTGMVFSAKSHDPSQTGGVPTPAKRVVLTFPSGTRINSAALPKCTSPPNCPASSQLGTGKAKVFIGTVALPLDAKVYNRSGGLVLVINAPTGPVVLKPQFSGLKLILDFPVLKVGETRAIVSEVSVTTGKIGSGARAYTTTPKACPAGHAWTFKALFTYEDGTSKSLTSKSPCTRS